YVLRKMTRHPVHYHTNSGLMTVVDEMTEIVGWTEPARRRVIICDLITPRPFERMLGNRQQFDVRVTHLHHVRQQRVGEFEISKLTLSFLPTPGTDVHLVNADRTLRPVLLLPRFHPFGVAPGI